MANHDEDSFRPKLKPSRSTDGALIPPEINAT